MVKRKTSTKIDDAIDNLKAEKDTVLIVDDEYDTIELLKAVLSPLDYNLLTAKSGKDALEIVEKENIDLILLDLMMPAMNGYEVCKRLKSNKKTRLIPVLVVSALSEVKDNVKAMDVGAEGFLAKPFNNQLVIAYAKSLIKVKKLTDELFKLDQLKDDLTKMIIHDLKNPLISALGFINLAKKEKSKDKIEWYQNVIKTGVSDALNLIENLHDITRLENDKLKLKKSNENVYLIIAETIDAMSPVFKKRGLNTKFVCECDIRHNVDIPLLKRIIQNLFTNAVKYADKNSTIMIHAAKKNNQLVIRVSNKGDIIPDEYRFKVFEKFGQVEMRKEDRNFGTGLGLAFCKLAVEAHNGKIWVESPAIDYNDGTSFIFEIE